MRNKSVFVWLLAMMWRFACAAVKILGRTGAIVVGVLMILIGLMMSLSIVGAIIGIPLAVVGAMFIVCALWKGRRGR